MSDANRVPLTIRLKPEDKEIFVGAAEEAGVEPGIAARQVLELVIKRLREENDFLNALIDVKQAMRVAPR